MRLVLTAEQSKALARTSLARPGCLLRPRLPDVFFRRLVPVHLREGHPLARAFGAPLMHVLVDARPRSGALEVRIFGAVADRSLLGVDRHEPLQSLGALDSETTNALATRLERIFGLQPPAEHERIPSIWEALVTAMLGGRVSEARGPSAAVITQRNSLVREFGTMATHGRHVFGALPDPVGLRERRVYELAMTGFPHRSARGLLGVARRVAQGKLALSSLFGKPKREVLDVLADVDGLSRARREFVLRYGVGAM